MRDVSKESLSTLCKSAEVCLEWKKSREVGKCNRKFFLVLYSNCEIDLILVAHFNTFLSYLVNIISQNLLIKKIST